MLDNQPIRKLMVQCMHAQFGLKTPAGWIRGRGWLRLWALIAVVLVWLDGCHSRAQQLLLSDNFNSGSTSAAGFNATLAVDQQGLVAPASYTVTTAGQD